MQHRRQLPTENENTPRSQTIKRRSKQNVGQARSSGEQNSIGNPNMDELFIYI